MPATYSDSTEVKAFREFNRNIPINSYCISNDSKPSFSDLIINQLPNFINSQMPIVLDLTYKAVNNEYERPSTETLSSLLLACKIIKESGYSIKSYDALEEGGVSLDMIFNHNHYLILEFYNSGDAVYYLERPDHNPLALDLDNNQLFTRLSEDLN